MVQFALTELLLDFIFAVEMARENRSGLYIFRGADGATVSRDVIEEV